MGYSVCTAVLDTCVVHITVVEQLSIFKLDGAAPLPEDPPDATPPLYIAVTFEPIIGIKNQMRSGMSL